MDANLIYSTIVQRTFALKKITIKLCLREFCDKKSRLSVLKILPDQLSFLLRKVSVTDWRQKQWQILCRN